MRDYTDRPGLLGQVLTLIDLAIPGVLDAARTAEAHGLRWDEASTPFLGYEGSTLVTHVGVLEVTLVLEGREVTVGGVHGVATHPEFRRRGHYRAAMEKALDWCASRYETVILTTEQPILYEGFGFRHVEEHRFVADSEGGGASGGLRELDRTRPEELELLHRLLWEREPVSRRFGVVREIPIFLVNTSRMRVCYAEDLDALLVYSSRKGTLRLFDVVARSMPSLAEILSRIPEPVSRVEVYFAPDRMDADLAAEPHLFTGDDHLMVKGPLAAKGSAFMYPLPARC